MIFALAYLIACTALAIACGYMIFAHRYPDGLLGKAALFPVWLCASAVVLRALDTRELPTVNPLDVWIVCGLCVFILRHLHRFFHHQRREPRPADFKVRRQ